MGQDNFDIHHVLCFLVAMRFFLLVCVDEPGDSDLRCLLSVEPHTDMWNEAISPCNSINQLL